MTWQGHTLKALPVFSPGFFLRSSGGVGQALGQGGGRNEEREEREKEKQQKGEEKRKQEEGMEWEKNRRHTQMSNSWGFFL